MAMQRIAQALKLACEYIVVKDLENHGRDIKTWGYLFLFMAETKLSEESAVALIRMLESGQPVKLYHNVRTLKLAGEDISADVVEELRLGRWISQLGATREWGPTEAAMRAWLAARGKAVQRVAGDA